MYDIIIIGAGAAGYTAGIYASRYNMKNTILSRDDGGMGAVAVEVENYPSVINIKGPDLMARFRDHALHYGTKLQIGVNVEQIKQNSAGEFIVNITDKEALIAKTVLIATGNKRRKLNIPTEDDFYGRGLSYCATCDGFFFKEKVVAVVGGGDAALTAALHMSDIAKKVYLVYRGPAEKMRAEPFWVKKAQAIKNIEFVVNAVPEKFSGDPMLEKIHFIDGRELEVQGCFVEIGAAPDTTWLTNLNLDLDQKGYIEIAKTSGTSMKGLFAAGDITNGSNHFEQFVTANAEAAIAVNSAFSYIKTL